MSTFNLKAWIKNVTETLAKKPVFFTGIVGDGMQDGYLCGVYDANTKIVTIHFACRSSSNISTSQTLLVVPAEYRPSTNKTLPASLYLSGGGSMAYRVTLSTTGYITQAGSSSTRGVFGSGSYKI